MFSKQLHAANVLSLSTNLLNYCFMNLPQHYIQIECFANINPLLEVLTKNSHSGTSLSFLGEVNRVSDLLINPPSICIISGPYINVTGNSLLF